MQPSLRKLMVSLIVLACSICMNGGTVVKKPMPNVTEENMLVKLPNRFYYFDGYDLHCYDTKSGLDTHIDDYAAGRGRTQDVWYDPVSDCVFLVEDGSGMLISNLYLYRLAVNNELKTMIALTGGRGEIRIDVTDDYVYLDGWVDEYEPLNLSGAIKGTPFSGYYTKDMKPWRMTKHSLDMLKKPDVSFLAVTSPGVNVRSYGYTGAPRLGYFKPRPGYEEESYMTNENAEVDSRVFSRTFIPWHPAVGDIFISNHEFSTNDEWTQITIPEEFSTVHGCVSSKFVKNLDLEPITDMQDIPEGDLKERVYRMNSAKYPGVWLMIGVLPMCGEAPLYIGKEIDGVVVFKWRAGWPVCSGEIGKGIHIDQDNNVFYGENATKNEYELDLSKINDVDLEMLFKVARPDGGMIMAKIPGHGVMTFSVGD